MSSKDFWDARYRESPESWGEKPNIFLEQFDLDGLSSAVDLAGGNGRNSLWLASQGLQVENIDISSVALEQFGSRARFRGLSDRCMGTEADATEAAFRFSPDLLLIAYLQISETDLSRAFANAIGQLQPGAKVLGVWHAVENLEAGYGGPQDESVLVSGDQLRQISSGFGWADLEIENRERVVSTDDGERVAIDVVLTGRLKV